eukprot:5023117-Prymnesium_polylepis.2
MTEKEKKGYFEDRRPASNMDPCAPPPHRARVANAPSPFPRPAGLARAHAERVPRCAPKRSRGAVLCCALREPPDTRPQLSTPAARRADIVTSKIIETTVLPDFK